MRTHGTLAKWNDDRGFGFITPAQGGEDLFVHVSAFPHDGARPRIGELISYETETNQDGKPRAIRIMRPGQASRRRPQRKDARSQRKQGSRGALIGILIVVALVVYGYSRFEMVTQPLGPEEMTDVDEADLQSPAAPSPFKCDGRTMCSQMTSCAEATYFIKHCPNTKMDGNNDGEPCEQQWCN